jgi:hypothetical protein
MNRVLRRALAMPVTNGAIIAKAANLVLGVAGGTAEPPMSGQCGDQTTQDGVSCCLVPVG